MSQANRKSGVRAVTIDGGIETDALQFVRIWRSSEIGAESEQPSLSICIVE